jgi:hypothetical protein
LTLREGHGDKTLGWKTWPFVILTYYNCDDKSLINVAAETVFRRVERRVFDIEEEWRPC